VALGADDDPELHFQDTMAAGAGLCDAPAVHALVEQAPEAVRWLIEMGVQFDRAQPAHAGHATSDGLLLGREAAHSRWRILHAGGDATGSEIERALTSALRKRPSVTLFERCYVRDLLVQDQACSGVRFIDANQQICTVQARATVLASGGAGGLWLRTSNPAGATADGVALAWSAGAAVKDLEFMQFHPTVLTVNGTSHLISEAVRGEGAYLRNHAGERFMSHYSANAELAPRDVVARAILSEMLAEHTNCQYLDLSHLPAQKIYERFPTISAICRQHGLDLATDLLPVAPAAHYCMGGVMVDTRGRTTLPNLYAVGEVACTGVHGANRLASNSLLEGLVYGLRVADWLSEPVQEPWICSCAPTTCQTYNSAHFTPQPLLAQADEHTTQRVRGTLQELMWHDVSLRRDRTGLLEAQANVQILRQQFANSANDESAQATSLPPAHWFETQHMLLVAELVIAAALKRRESRGSHWRADYQSMDANLAGQHNVFQRAGIDADGLAQPQEEVMPRV
jgi:L-aspartate oxidase